MTSLTLPASACLLACMRRLQDTSSDKERAYAEARARIFGSEGGGDSSATASGSGSSTSAVSGPARAGSQRAQAVVINTSEKKVTYRDRQKEMCDPDFVRRGPQVSMSAVGYASNSGE